MNRKSRRVLIAVVLGVCVCNVGARQASSLELAESDFRRDGQDEWRISGGGGGKAEILFSKALAYHGKGTEWFFVAPRKFLGDKVC